MAEFDTTSITNPMKEDFAVNFNGERYEIGAGEQKSFPEFLAFHIAKHLSDKMLNDEVQKIKNADKENPFNPRVGQMLVYDNPQRRMRLYDILGSKARVEACINAYPFKGFIGELEEYDNYVASTTVAPTKEVNMVPDEPESDEVEEKPKKKTTYKRKYTSSK